MTPAYIISVLAVLFNTVGTVISLIVYQNPIEVLVTILCSVAGVYLVFLCFSIPLTISEWHSLRAGACKKILYAFTFPLFMFTFIPIAFIALFKREVKWTPIAHGEKKVKK